MSVERPGTSAACFGAGDDVAPGEGDPDGDALGEVVGVALDEGVGDCEEASGRVRNMASMQRTAIIPIALDLLLNEVLLYAVAPGAAATDVAPRRRPRCDRPSTVSFDEQPGSSCGRFGPLVLDGLARNAQLVPLFGGAPLRRQAA